MPAVQPPGLRPALVEGVCDHAGVDAVSCGELEQPTAAHVEQSRQVQPALAL